MNCSRLHDIKLEGKCSMKFLSLIENFMVRSSLGSNCGVTLCVFKVTRVVHLCPGFFIHWKCTYTYTCTYMHTTLPSTKEENGHYSISLILCILFLSSDIWKSGPFCRHLSRGAWQALQSTGSQRAGHDWIIILFKERDYFLKKQQKIPQLL